MNTRRSARSNSSTSTTSSLADPAPLVDPTPTPSPSEGQEVRIAALESRLDRLMVFLENYSAHGMLQNFGEGANAPGSSNPSQTHPLEQHPQQAAAAQNQTATPNALPNQT